jgi:hypothetical protein
MISILILLTGWLTLGFPNDMRVMLYGGVYLDNNALMVCLPTVARRIAIPTTVSLRTSLHHAPSTS